MNDHLIYRPEIDGLRAVAVIPVIFFHAGFNAFGGGSVGVDVFFVISGYLITTIILSELERGEFSLMRFYERRARRILPALFVVMACCIPVAGLWMLPSQYKEFSQSIIAVCFFVSNILFWREEEYFALAAGEKPLLHTWSLAVEEQYYILFPLLLILLWRFGREHAVMSVVLAITVVSLILSEWAWRNAPVANFYLAPTRAWELMAGSICALILRDGRPFNGGTLGNIASLAGLTSILYSILAFNKTTPAPSVYTVVPVIGVCLIILFGSAATATARLLALKPFVGIGLVSYGAYLWHQPLFALAKLRSSLPPSTEYMMLLTALCFPLAFITWQIIERPFRSNVLFSNTTLWGSSCIALTSFILVGAAGYLTNGFYQLRFNDAQRAVLETALASPLREKCHARDDNYLKPSEACELNSTGSTWAVFGNSHAVELAFALGKQLKLRNTGVRQFTYGAGCPPSYGRLNENRDGCASWTNEAVEFIAADKIIDTVVVSYRMQDHLVDRTVAAASWEEKRWKSYLEIVEKFVQAGKTTIVVLQAPLLPKPVDYYVMREKRNFEFLVGVDRALWEKSADFIFHRLNQLTKEAIIVQPADLFCNSRSCAAVKDGKALYFDDDHMSVYGASLIAREIVHKWDSRNNLSTRAGALHPPAPVVGRP